MSNQLGPDSGCSGIRQQGMILVIVLWLVTLLSVMAGAFAYSMRTETQLAISTVERAQARALAEAGVAYAMVWQLDFDQSRKAWPPNGDPHEWLFGDGRLRIEVTNANGLVSLNAASKELLNVLFSGIGVDSRDRDQLVEAILNWSASNQQDGGLGRRISGKGKSRKAGFESVEDLQQIEGMSQTLYQRVVEGVTPFSRHVGVNPEFAPAWLLRDLGLEETVVNDYVSNRARAAVADSPAPPLPSSTGSQAIFAAGRTTVYHIAVTALTETGVSATVKAVADMQGGGIAGQDLRILAWREGR